MGMKVYGRLPIIAVALIPVVSAAHVEITEIMYDLEGGDSGREWIEIKNTGSEPLDLSDWKLFENDTNHGLSLSQGAETLPPGGYAIIADNPTKFLADWDYQGTLFDSAFSLNNTGESLALRCCGKELSDRDTAAYTSDAGAQGDGSSLHRSGNSFVTGTPSPGSGAIEAKKSEPVETVSDPPAPPPKKAEEKTIDPPQAAPEPVVASTKGSESADTSDPAPNTVSVVAPAPVATPIVSEKNPSLQESVSASPKSKPKQKPKPSIRSSVQEVEEEPVRDIVPPHEEEVLNAATGTGEVQAAAAAHASGPGWQWYGGAAAVTLLSALGAYAVGRLRKSEWEIEEIE